MNHPIAGQTPVPTTGFTSGAVAGTPNFAPAPGSAPQMGAANPQRPDDAPDAGLKRQAGDN